MSFHWFSRKGNQCQDNRDYGGLLRKRSYELALIVDASQKGGNGADLAKKIVDSIIREVQGINDIDPEKLLETIRKIHQSIKSEYLAETASYAIAIFDSNGSGWAIACGDCRVGLVSESKKNWITPVHSLANWQGEVFNKEHALMPERSTLTRCWHTKRFKCPDIVALHACGQSICLATDGYWLEYEWMDCKLHNLIDDASCLIIGALGEINSDCDNFRLTQI